MHQQLSMHEVNRQEDHLPTCTNLHDHKLSLTIEKTSLPRTNAYTLPTLSYARKREEKKNHRHHVHRHKGESAQVKAHTENVACMNKVSSSNVAYYNNNHDFQKVSVSSPSKSKSNSQEVSMNKSHPSLIMAKTPTPLKTPEARYVASLETLINWEKSLRSSYNYALTPVRHHLSKLETSTSTSTPHAKAEQQQQQQQENDEEHVDVDNKYHHRQFTAHASNKFSKMFNSSEKKVNNTNWLQDKNSSAYEVDMIDGSKREVQSLTELFTSPFAPLERNRLYKARTSIAHTQSRLQAYRTLERLFIPLWRQYRERQRCHAEGVMRRAMRRRSSTNEIHKRQVAAEVVLQALRYSCSTFAILFRRVHQLAERIQRSIQAYHRRMEAVVEVNYRKIRRDIEEKYWKQVEEDELFRMSMERKKYNTNTNNNNNNHLPSYTVKHTAISKSILESQKKNKLYYLAVDGTRGALFALVGRQPESLLKNEIRRAIRTRLRNAVRRVCRAQHLILMYNQKLLTDSRTTCNFNNGLSKEISVIPRNKSVNEEEKAKINTRQDKCSDTEHYVDKFDRWFAEQRLQNAKVIDGKNDKFMCIRDEETNDNDDNDDLVDDEFGNNEQSSNRLQEEMNWEELWELPVYHDDNENDDNGNDDHRRPRDNNPTTTKSSTRNATNENSKENVNNNRRNVFAAIDTTKAAMTTPTTVVAPFTKNATKQAVQSIPHSTPVKVPVFLNNKIYTAIMDNTCYVTGKMRNDKTVSAHLMHRLHPVTPYEELK